MIKIKKTEQWIKGFILSGARLDGLLPQGFHCLGLFLSQGDSQ